MKKFRKKPVVIHAVQWDGSDNALIDIGVLSRDKATVVGELEDGTLEIPTLEGVMKANLDDWIIRGVNGEIYPCKPDIFAKTYEPA